MQVTNEMVEAAAQSDAEFDKRGWLSMPRTERERYLARARKSLTAALAKVKCATVEYDHSNIAGHIYYVKLAGAKPPPYLVQRRVEAILDIAEDGTLAGIDLIDDMPPPPATPEASE